METSILSGGTGENAGNADLIKDTTTAEFAKDVIEQSRQYPVLVDFWAPWCGPCKQLTPILEKIIKQAKGAVRLVKMNIDEHPAIASQLGVQSIPAVFAFKDGRPIDGFMGALPESQLKSFIEKIVGPDALGGIEDVLETAQESFDAGNFQEAAEIYAAILGEDRTNVKAIAGLADCHIAVGELSRAEETLSLTPKQSLSASEITTVRAKLALARKDGGDDRDLEALRSALSADPNDHQARFDLALGLNSAGQKTEAMDALFEILKQDRDWNDGAAQKQLVEFFSAWGPDDTCAIQGRRRLSSILFA